MSRYRRSNETGATYFFTLAIEDRASGLLTIEVDRLRKAYQAVAKKYPFETVAICVLPDHLHAIWRLPEGDAAFGQRWGLIKRNFSIGLPALPARGESKIAKREKGIWQRRFWEHQIRDDADLERHVDYLHYNPVKHGLVACVNDWPHSSFHRFVKSGLLTADWGGGYVEGDGEFGEARVGKAQRAHADGAQVKHPRGHAALCPPYP